MLWLFNQHNVSIAIFTTDCLEVQVLASLYTLPTGSVNVQVRAIVPVCKALRTSLSCNAAWLSWVLLT